MRPEFALSPVSSLFGWGLKYGPSFGMWHTRRIQGFQIGSPDKRSMALTLDPCGLQLWGPSYSQAVSTTWGEGVLFGGGVRTEEPYYFGFTFGPLIFENSHYKPAWTPTNT